MKKAQAAMEFLMTYRWMIILIVLIATGTMFYFDVLDIPEEEESKWVPVYNCGWFRPAPPPEIICQKILYLNNNTLGTSQEVDYDINAKRLRFCLGLNEATNKMGLYLQTCVVKTMSYHYQGDYLEQIVGIEIPQHIADEVEAEMHKLDPNW